jgi:hypothetical protein
MVLWGAHARRVRPPEHCRFTARQYGFFIPSIIPGAPYPWRSRLGLGNSSRQRRNDVNVIGNSAHEQRFATQVAADRRQDKRACEAVWPGRASARDLHTKMI